MVKITRTPIDNVDEHNLLMGCIVSTTFLERIHNTLSKSMFLIQDTNIKTILYWCFDYFEKHNSAPQGLIQDIFISKQKDLRTDAMIESIASVLENVNTRYIEKSSTFSEDYYLEKAKRYLEEQAFIRLSDEIKGAIAQGKLEEARKLLINFHKVETELSLGIDPFNDPSVVNSIFEGLTEGLFEFPFPALQTAFKQIYRNDLVAVSGPAKSGKSFIMNQFGLYGLNSGLNVAMFSFEMNVSIMSARLFQNLLAETRMPEDKEITVPYFEDNGNIAYNTYMKTGLEYQRVLEYQQEFASFQQRGRLRFFDSNTCGRRVSDMVSALQRLEKYENFKPDVVIIDYDALLDNEVNMSNYDGINQLWKDIKNKICQDFNCVGVLGSQLNKTAALTESGSPLEASGSSRKFDYVSLWVSIKTNSAYRKCGISRISIEGRHHEFTEGDLVILQSLATARPVVGCRFLRDVPNFKEIVKKAKQDMEPEEEEEDGGKVNKYAKKADKTSQDTFFSST